MSQRPMSGGRALLILIAPDSFKGSLTALEAARAIAGGIRRARPDAVPDLLPIADGGEGTTDTLLAAAGGERRPVVVTGPLGEPIDSFYGLLADGKTAALEAAAACGLTQVPPHRRDPGITTSRGLGELMLAAAESLAEAATRDSSSIANDRSWSGSEPRTTATTASVRDGSVHISSEDEGSAGHDSLSARLIVGIGGSATNDGGSGMLRALGARLLDADGRDLPDGGAALARLDRIDLSGWRWPTPGPEILVASDVGNPLCGEDGASAVFGPQKGASPTQVRELDSALARFATVAAALLGRDCSHEPGAGAAGGIGFALMAFLGASLRPGVDLILETTRFADRAARADLIVTGEGSLDAQTGMGKAVLGVARAGRRAGKPVVALAGSLAGDLRPLRDEGLVAAASIAAGPLSLEEMMRGAEGLLADAAERMMGWLAVGSVFSLPSDPDLP